MTHPPPRAGDSVTVARAREKHRLGAGAVSLFCLGDGVFGRRGATGNLRNLIVVLCGRAVKTKNSLRQSALI
jgi:hypothetical protein